MESFELHVLDADTQGHLMQIIYAYKGEIEDLLYANRYFQVMGEHPDVAKLFAFQFEMGELIGQLKNTNKIPAYVYERILQIERDLINTQERRNTLYTELEYDEEPAEPNEFFEEDPELFTEYYPEKNIFFCWDISEDFEGEGFRAGIDSEDNVYVEHRDYLDKLGWER